MPSTRFTGMTKQQRLCAWMHVMSGLAIMLLLSVTLAYFASRFGDSSISAESKPLLGSVAIAVGTALCMVAGLEIVGGLAFLASKPFGRPLLLLSAAFHVINVPIGTALSIYTFWAFFRAGSHISS